MYSAIDAFVHHILEPLMIHSSPLITARVRTPPCRSEPAPGSVRARAPSLPLPLVTSGSQRCFNSSLPYFTRGEVPRPLWAARARAVEPQPHPSSSMAITALTASTSAPPYCSGMVNPRSPNAAPLRAAAQLNSPLSSTSCALGCTSFATKSWTTRCQARCSSVRSKSILFPRRA